MAQRRHLPLTVQHRWLCQVLRGHYGYFGVTFNYRALTAFLEGVKRRWLRALARRGQKRRMNWQRFADLLAVFPLPKPRVHHALTGTR